VTLPWSPELEAVEQKKRTEVEEAILAAKGNITRAAKALGVARSYMNTLMRRYELVEAAKALRIETGGHRGAGRPVLRKARN
jgi:transcriptional regulator with GAF, ATPase, and Fis domain